MTDTGDDGADIRVLCVDDDPDFRELVSIFLDERREDMSVETVSSGEAVLDRLPAGGIDCIVSDFRMGTMDGLTLLEGVRARHPRLPFIIFTGRGGEEVAAEAVSAGVTDYIRKSSDPAQFELLANRIHNVVERHRAQVQYQAIFDSVGEGLLVIDSTTETVIDANQHACVLWGYDADELLSRPLDELLEPTESNPADRPTLSSAFANVEPTDSDAFGVSWTLTSSSDHALPESEADPSVAEWRCRTKDGQLFWGAVNRKQAEIGGQVRTLVIIRDVTRRVIRQQQLDELLATVSSLLVVSTEEEITDVVESTVVESLRFSEAQLYRLNQAGNGFSRPNRDGSSELDPSAEALERFWDAIDSGTIVRIDRDPEDHSKQRGTFTSPASIYRVEEASTLDTRRLVFPLGDFGVLDCRPGHETDAYDVELVALLVTFATSAFDRSQREAVLRERERELRLQRDELVAVDHVNAVIRDINQALVSVSSKEGIDRLVCEKFVSTDPYRLAWIGEFDPRDEAIRPTVSAGRNEGYLPEEFSTAIPEHELLAKTVNDRSVQVIDRITPETFPEGRYRLARERDFRSVAFVPVIHQGVIYRLLAIYSDQPQAFGDREVAVLGELGETIGHAVAASEWRSSRISSSLIELDVAVEHDDALFALDEPSELQLTDMWETSDGSLRVFGRLTGTTYAAFESAIESVSTLDEPLLIGDQDGELQVGFSIQSGPLRDVITSEGVSLSAGRIAEGSGSFTITVPAGANIRWVVERLEAAFTSVELLGRRDKPRTEASGRFGEGFTSLTDRQQEVLQIAFHAGYFETPRAASGTDVAEILGISQPTFNEHLRNAERQLFEWLLTAYPAGR